MNVKWKASLQLHVAIIFAASTARNITVPMGLTMGLNM